MTAAFASRVFETSTTEGTGTYTLAGAQAGFQGFVAAIGNGHRCYYHATDDVNWEVGIGTVASGSSATLARTSVLFSSNGGAAVNWGPGTRSIIGGQLSADFAQKLMEGRATYWLDTGAANALVITPAPNIQAYAAGQSFGVKVANNVTGSATINVNGLGAKAIKKRFNVDPASGDIVAGQMIVLQYDGTNFQLASPVATAPVAAGNGIAVTGNSVAVDLAANSGLEISGAKLRAKPGAAASATPAVADKLLFSDVTDSDAPKYASIEDVLALMPGDQVARDMAASALILADLNGVAGTKGAFYLADPFTSDTLAVKTNAVYDSSGDYYAPVALDILPTMSSGTTSGVTISASGNNSGDDPWKAADDSTTTHWTITATSGIWTVQLSGGATISTYTITGINTGGTVNGGSPNTSMPPQAWTLQGSNNGSDWTTVDTVTGQTGWSSLQKRTFTVDSPGSYSYYRLNITSNNGSSYTSLCEVELLGAPQNVTLRPSAATLLSADPADLIGYFGFDPQEAVTAGTDFIGKGSIDGGSTWATGSWTRVGSGQADEEIWRLDVDVSGQTGSSVIYEITTANNKSVRYTRCGGVVPLY